MSGTSTDRRFEFEVIDCVNFCEIDGTYLNSNLIIKHNNSAKKITSVNTTMNTTKEEKNDSKDKCNIM